MLFNFYWNTVGLSLSRLKGPLIDTLPFSITEVLIWFSMASIIVLLLRFIRPVRQFLSPKALKLLKTPPTWLLILMGPAIFVILASNQGAFPWAIAPTAWRTPIAAAHKGPAVPHDVFKQYVKQADSLLQAHFNQESYEALSEEDVLIHCNSMLDSVLKMLALPPGRRVRRVKNMAGISLIMGLSYGGPGFHSPFTGEAALASARHYPSPIYQRIHGICHEAAHAKGFTRELDTEIITQLALLLSPDSQIKAVGYIMFLTKSGEPFNWPHYLKSERLAKHQQRQETLKHQPLVRMLKRINKALSFQNSGAKYGTRANNEVWDPAHNYFTTVINLSQNLGLVPSSEK